MSFSKQLAICSFFLSESNIYHEKGDRKADAFIYVVSLLT